MLVALDVIGGALIVVGIWGAYDGWRAIVALGVGCIAVSQLIERRFNRPGPLWPLSVRSPRPDRGDDDDG